MSNRIDTTNVSVQFELEDDRSIVVVLDRPTDCILMTWQAAFDLADVLGQVIRDARNPLDVIDMPTILREQGQIRLGVHSRLVSLVFDHTDRIRYSSWRTAELLRQALLVKAQDVQQAERAVIMDTLRTDGKLVKPARLVSAQGLRRPQPRHRRRRAA